MSDPRLVREIISQILQAIGRIERRMIRINNANDFVSSEAGNDMLDAISMMLVAIGESCKNLDKITEGIILARHSGVDWKGVKGIRDIISHHYFDINAEIVYSVCRKHIPVLKRAFEAMLLEIE